MKKCKKCAIQNKLKKNGRKKEPNKYCQRKIVKERA